MTPGQHVGHREVTLAITEKLPDGGLLYQSWPICGCTLAALRERLGAPRHESLATAEQAAATVEALLSVPGTTHIGEDL